MKYLLLLLLVFLCSCHSGSSKKGVNDGTDSIQRQKEILILKHYIDSVFENDTVLQQRFHCYGAGVGKGKVFVDFEIVPEDSFPILVRLFKKEVINSPLLEFNNVEYITDGPLFIPSTKEDTNQSQTKDFVLSPVSRDIPIGEAINPDSLSMQAEYDYYPLSTTEIKVIITNHSYYEYDCGEGYSLAYYNKNKQQWETLPTAPIINDILWIFPAQNPTHQQTVKLYTSEVPNRPGKYRIYKSFNRGTKVAYAEFELVDKKGVEQLRKRIDDYWEKEKEKDNYAAIDHRKVRQDVLFTQPTFSQTLQAGMNVEQAV